MNGQNAKSDDSIKIIKAQFGREASKYTTSKIHSNQEDLNFVKKIINPQDHWECLDIATGAGHLAHIIAQNSKHVIASDITPEMLHEATKLAKDKSIHNIEFEEFDVHSIPHKENKFDLAMSRIAPHHFYDISLAISEMVRVTKPGGFVFIEDTVSPNNGAAGDLFNKIEILRDPSHKKDLTKDEWAESFLQNNCEVIKQDARQKKWPLKWWTERMSTPHKNVKEIISLLEANYPEFKDDIGIIFNSEDYENKDTLEEKIESWEITPKNIYLLAKKNMSN